MRSAFLRNFYSLTVFFHVILKKCRNQKIVIHLTVFSTTIFYSE